MATFNTSHYNATKPDRTNPSRLAAPNVSDGEIEVACIPYTLTGSEAANDTINLCILPAGVIPVPQLSKVTCADPGTTLTLDVGTANNPDEWADGITLSSGGQIEFTSGTAPAQMTSPSALVADAASGNAVVYATVASANTLTADVVLYFCLAYKRGK